MPKTFYITAPRYVRQAGEMEPNYVVASPQRPARIVLDDDVEPSKSDRGLRAERPAALKPHHAGKKKPAVRKSHEPRLEEEPEGGAEQSGTRLADQ